LWSADSLKELASKMRKSDEQKQETRIGKENQTKEYHAVIETDSASITLLATIGKAYLLHARREKMTKREKKMSSQYRYVSWLWGGEGFGANINDRINVVTFVGMRKTKAWFHEGLSGSPEVFLCVASVTTLIQKARSLSRLLAGIFFLAGNMFPLVGCM
jgi:hypothetical protein